MHVYVYIVCIASEASRVYDCLGCCSIVISVSHAYTDLSAVCLAAVSLWIHVAAMDPRAEIVDTRVGISAPCNISATL